MNNLPDQDPADHVGTHLFQGGYHYYSNGDDWVIINASPDPMYVEIGAEEEVVCECGSDAANSPKHSSWCKKYQP